MRDISQHEHTGADRINSVSPRVFIVQQQHRSEPNTGILLPKYDFSTAEQYGRLIVLLGPRCNAFNPQSVVPELRAKLADYGDADCLLLAGNPTLIGWAAAIAARASLENAAQSDQISPSMYEASIETEDPGETDVGTVDEGYRVVDDPAEAQRQQPPATRSKPRRGAA